MTWYLRSAVFGGVALLVVAGCGGSGGAGSQRGVGAVPASATPSAASAPSPTGTPQPPDELPGTLCTATPSAGDPPPIGDGCWRTGCSAQLCADRPIISTCEWLPEYACYAYAVCQRQADGTCGWTATDAFERCRVDVSLPTPTETPDGPADSCSVERDAVDRTAPNFPPSLPLASCSGGGSDYVTPPDAVPADASEELHVIGVYEGSNAGGSARSGHTTGMVEIVIHPRPKPIVLALSAYEAVRWRLTIEAGAVLARVITQGYYTQTVEGVPDGVPVVQRAPGAACGYAYGWEVRYNAGGGDYARMIADIRAYTGLIETSFQGCYAGIEFDVPYWGDREPPTEKPTPLPLDESIARQDIVFPGCEAVTAEHEYCLTTTYSGPAVVGLDSGSVCEIAPAASGAVFDDVTSIAWRGEAMYACSYDAGLIRVSLRDGRSELAQVPCQAVTDHDDNLLILSSDADPFTDFWDALLEYPTYAAVLRGAHTAAYNAGDTFEAMTAHGDALYGAWHSTDTIDVVDLSGGATRSAIALQGYDGWILGMAVTDHGELVISGDSWGDTIRIFDAATGATLRELHPTQPVWGLSCVTRE